MAGTKISLLVLAIFYRHDPSPRTTPLRHPPPLDCFWAPFLWVSVIPTTTYPMALDYIDHQNAFRACTFIHILGRVPDGTCPSSLILLCTLLSLFVDRFCFRSFRTVSSCIMFYVIVACLYCITTHFFSLSVAFRAFQSDSGLSLSCNHVMCIRPHPRSLHRDCILPFTTSSLLTSCSRLSPIHLFFSHHGPQHPRF
jgi:hypothetical protein